MVNESLHTVATPFGELHLYIRADGQLITTESELCTVREHSFSEANTEGGSLVQLHLTPAKSVKHLQAHCRWSSIESIGRGRPEHCPGRNILRWTDDSHTCLLATEDVSALRKRMSPGSNLHTILSEITSEMDHLVFEHRDDGITIRLSELSPRDPLELTFLIVWDSLHASSSIDRCTLIAMGEWSEYLTESA